MDSIIEPWTVYLSSVTKTKSALLNYAGNYAGRAENSDV